jgi:sphingosine kinase
MCYMAADAPFFPASLPSDGLLDLVTIDGDVGRLKSLQMMLAVEDNKLFDMPQVNMRKISAVRVVPRYKNGVFAVCGEKFPFEPFQIEIHRGLGTVLSKRPGLYEGPGPEGWEALGEGDDEATGSD